MITKKTVVTVDLTPEKAHEFATMTPFPGERPERQTRLQYLYDQLRDGSFYGCEWATASVRGSAEVYRANGQHSSKMLSKLKPQEFPKGLMATISHYEIDSVNGDGFTLFNSFDNPKSSRSNEDVMSLQRSHHADLEHIPLKTLMHAARGIAYARRQANAQLMKQANKSKDSVLPTLIAPYTGRTAGDYYGDQANRQFAIWLDRLTATSPLTLTFIFTMQGEVAAMYNDWKVNPTSAAHFWAMVISESYPDPEHITREFAVKIRSWHDEARKKQEDYFKEARKISKRFFEKATGFLPPMPPPQPDQPNQPSV